MTRVVISRDDREWLEHLESIGFPLREYHLGPIAVRKQLAIWYRKARNDWTRNKHTGRATLPSNPGL